MSTPAIVRLMRRVEADANGCWIWTGSCSSTGYGTMRLGDGSTVSTHAYAWSVFRPDVCLDGLELDHVCRVKLCVNPEHLEPVTHAENVHRARLAKGYVSHCKRGHRYSGDNLIIYTGRGRAERRCRACRSASDARRRGSRKNAS